MYVFKYLHSRYNNYCKKNCLRYFLLISNFTLRCLTNLTTNILDSFGFSSIKI